MIKNNAPIQKYQPRCIKSSTPTITSFFLYGGLYLPTWKGKNENTAKKIFVTGMGQEK